MKNTLYLLIAIFLLTTGCNRPAPTTLCNELLRAEELMYPAPDSALHILQGITPPADELNRATWALLLTQAKYKCDVVQSDSLVNVAYDYFMKGDDAQRKALALYLKGGLLNDNNQYEKALGFFLDAEKELDKINEDTLGFLITSHIGLIYAYQNLNEYAINYSFKAYEHASKSNYHKHLIAACIQLARTYSKINIDNSIEYYEEAINLAKKHGDIRQTARAQIEVAGRYKEHPQKLYSKAILNIIKYKRSHQGKAIGTSGYYIGRYI